MKILAIDPGLARTGWAVLEKVSHSTATDGIIMKDCGCIITKSSMPLPERLLILYSSLEGIIKKEMPDTLCLEKQYLYQNAQSVLSTSEARGVIILLAAKKGISVQEYNPKSVKVAITGYGGADKNQVREMVKRLLNIKTLPVIKDVSDAIAVGLCHLNSIRL